VLGGSLYARCDRSVTLCGSKDVDVTMWWGLHNKSTSLSNGSTLAYSKSTFNSYNGLADVFVQLQAFQALRKNCPNPLTNLIAWKLFLGPHTLLFSGPGSSVGIATDCGLDGPGIEFRWGEIFRTCPDRPWGPPSLLYNGYRVFPGGKVRLGRAADHSPPSKNTVMEE
jgi:hypothetical protein